MGGGGGGEEEEVWEHHRGDVTSRPSSQHPSLPPSHHTRTHSHTHTHTHTHEQQQQQQHATGVGETCRNFECASLEMTSCDSAGTCDVFLSDALYVYVCVCVCVRAHVCLCMFAYSDHVHHPLSTVVGCSQVQLEANCHRALARLK